MTLCDLCVCNKLRPLPLTKHASKKKTTAKAFKNVLFTQQSKSTLLFAK